MTIKSAFALLGLAKSLSKQLGLGKAAGEKIVQEMTSGDYENLVQTLERHFGKYITIYR